VATQGLRPTRSGEDESSVRNEWASESRDGLGAAHCWAARALAAARVKTLARAGAGAGERTVTNKRTQEQP
jgi:hypothetical protein